MKEIFGSQKGVYTVEAAIYFPLTIAAVMFIIYSGLMKFQEAAFIYAIQRTSLYGANEVAYPGYDILAGSSDIPLKINFDWEDDDYLEGDVIKNYYIAGHKELKYLYNEFSGSPWTSAGELTEQMKKTAQSVSLLSYAGGADYNVEIKRSIWGSDVLVSVEYSVETPGILRYLNMKPKYSYKRVAYSSAINPTGFARNLDLAVDGIHWIADQLGIDIDGFFDKLTAAVDKFF